MITVNQFKGSCGDKNFGFSWLETERTANNDWIFGEFEIFLNNRQILEYADNYTLNCLFSYFKENIPKLSELETNTSEKTKEDLFLNSLRAMRYWTYIEQEEYEAVIKNISSDDYDNSEEERVLRKINNFLEEYNPNCEVGLYLNVHTEISDQGWEFLIFKTEKKDRLLYSKNQGKTVFEILLPLGTVKKVLSELPDV